MISKLLTVLFCFSASLAPCLVAQAKKPVRTIAARQAEYAVRAGKLSDSDSLGHFSLAKWCKQNSLHKQMRSEARLVIALEPQHAGAHALLGKMKANGKWLPRHRAMKALGYTYHRSKWLSRAAYKKMRVLEARKKHVRKIQRDVNRLARKLASASARKRVAARTDLIAIARAERIPKLGYHTDRAFYAYQKYWKRYWREHATATLEIRLQKSELLGIDNISTSLGFGAPVTLQLPRTRNISIGTTVTVPLGLGR